MSRKFKCHQNLTRIRGILHEDICTFVIISRSILRRMRNVSEKVVEKIRTLVLYLVSFSRNHAVFKIMWKNMVQTDRQQMAI
jgi:hypothetical protein